MNLPMICIIDDNPNITASLKDLIESVGYTTALYSDAISFLANHDADNIACIIADIRMPYMTGLELQTEIKHRKIDLPILFISGHADVPTAVRAIQAGAIGFMLKPIDNQSLIEKINQCTQTFPAAQEKRHQTTALRKSIEQLTRRERQVLYLMVHAETAKAIARTLDIKSSTAELYRANIKKKLGIGSSAQLIYKILTYNLTESLQPYAPNSSLPISKHTHITRLQTQ